ncbi:hypothetical protein LVB87_15160 [Lysobacter sp. KIS68-7]|uniref:hypothetical protein n=1 Tax=Lysobacter sp. KIS68-7 TaxID=2904252 RepID=UPI001E468A72|nr:hypothetical protein [Lysobacter sp. KIS68-7]UHQ19506.1 hypothetical protein LVB87_15160 [Lysobacter sp. KIS68-7]
MRANQLILRCYAERSGDIWNAYCLDLSLGSQGDTYADARKKLDEQIEEFVQDVLTGEDRPHAVYLLSRRAPLPMWLKYYAIKALIVVIHAFGLHAPTSRKRFKEVLPLAPAHCN